MGHEGLEKGEDFRAASYEQQREWIRRATEAVEKAAGVRPIISAHQISGSVKPHCARSKKKGTALILQIRLAASTWGSDEFIISNISGRRSSLTGRHKGILTGPARA